MSNTVISVENLSKAYRLGALGGRTLREDFARWWARLRGQPDPFLKIGEEHKQRLANTGSKAFQRFSLSAFRRFRPASRSTAHTSDVFWALRNVSFEVKQGEVLGIIGRNGAGKSTLLKILSRVTGPTEGQIRVKSRIASLLEVGTGFHPDLTGRENVFLNGAILGMTKAEIRKKFDEIVAFAEIEEFIDTPVKRYSSGMYVRLAFAVAAHLEPEILIVDEVLAVGDAEFQKKCLGKMKDVSREEGRTVLFVSHNLNAVTSLCSRTLVLKHGSLVFKGNVRDGLAHYGAASEVSDCIHLMEPNRKAILKTVSILQNDQPTGGMLEPGGKVTLRFLLESHALLKRPKLSVGFTNARGERIFAVGSSLGPMPLPPMLGRRAIQILFDMPPVMPGRYSLDIGLYDTESRVFEEYYSAGSVEIVEINYLRMAEPRFSEIGYLYVRSVCQLLPLAMV